MIISKKQYIISLNLVSSKKRAIIGHLVCCRHFKKKKKKKCNVLHNGLFVHLSI